MEKQFEEYLAAVNQTLSRFLGAEMTPKEVLRAMEYSASAGGKRIRPLLTLEFTRLCGGDWEKALPFAAAVEMVHTYSLIHDDLPAMDNDALRRGKPSCHVQFGEATALLAGDGLLTMAFEALSDAELPPERIVRAVRELSRKAGVRGMIGGQELDLANENAGNLAVERLRETDEKKTGALLAAACTLGVAAAGGDEEAFDAAGRYARALGLAFQIVDDLLDVEGDPALLGKPVGSDHENGKATYATVLGLSGARALAAEYTEEALAALRFFHGSEALAELTKTLLSRSS